MLSRSRLVFIALSLSVVLALVVTTMLAASSQGDETDSPYKPLAVFMEVFGLVNKAYVDEPDTSTLMAGAFEGTLDALDPFSQYVPASAVETHRAVHEVGTRHSGLSMLKERGVAYVVAVEEGSPAHEAGLEQGDILSEVNGLPTRRTPLLRLQQILAGEPGTVVTLERLRQGNKETVEMTLAEYPRPAVVLEAMKGVAVLRVPGFYGHTAESVAASLEALSRGAEALPGLEMAGKLVVDLRGVAGGEEPVAYDVAGLFVQGELGALERRGEALETFTSEDEPIWTGRLVVLVDRGTQGPAEILTKVLEASRDAVLVGEPSFGHSGRQDLVTLSDGGRLRITGAFFTGPDREPLTEPLVPDLRVRRWVSEEGDADDPILERGLQFLIDDEELETEELAEAA